MRPAFTSRVKPIAAALVLVSLALPFSTCTYFVDPHGNRITVEAGESPPPDARRVEEHSYAVSSFSWSEPASLLWILAFGWPLAWWSYGAFGKRARLKRLIWWLEPLLACFSVLYFIFLAVPGQAAEGFSIACGGIALYFLAWLLELIALARTWWRRAA